MDQIQKVEQEILELRQKLREKEDELYALKLNYHSSQSAQAHNGDESQITEETTIKQWTLPKWAIERYSRQILLREIGVAGQARICAAKVLIVGAGGLGCPAAMYLAGAGVGEIGIVDYDTVEISNIHRQLLHREIDTDVNKAESAARAIRSINSHIKVTPYKVQLDSTNAIQIASKYDVVLDCTDNAPTRYLLSDLCVLAKLPLISGSALKLEGQLTVYCYRADLHSVDKSSTYRGPCYRCVFSVPPSPDALGSCSQHGVAPPVPGVIGTLQATEALKFIIGHPSRNLLVERMLIMDVDDMSCKVVQLRPRNPMCAICSDTPTITQLIDYEVFCKTQAKEKKRAENRQKSEKRKQEKVKRMTGQSYFGFRSETKGKKTLYIQDVLKAERKIGPICKSDICVKNTKRYCTKFIENDRLKIFQDFWKLDWSEKKIYVRNLINTVPVKRRRNTNLINSRKVDSKKYFLYLNGNRVEVCRVTFLNTLGIKEAMVRSWLHEKEKTKNAKIPVKSISVINFIDGLPKRQSKCQICLDNNIQLSYVNFSVKNQFELYKLYVKFSTSNGVPPASRKTFDKVLVRKNLRIFKAKNEKDVCDLNSQHNISYQNDKLDYYYSNLEQWT
ncbi:ubiquitin-like activating enzyme 4 isoform X1 [Anticarsia gemmatalis]|uniref:ubiquitin-like activating enzyme 4 isoform X1 n=1 Tax=Anticarsia gemmatalis TaxID=129554 RepID=UPI003F758DD8